MSKNAAEPLRGGPSRAGFVRTAAWLEAHAWLVVTSFAAVYAVGTGALAWRKPIGNDELFTYLISRVSSLGDLWHTLETGAEQTPPLSHLLTRASFGVFGDGRLALRLPELIAFFVFCLCTYAVVARRSSRLYGLVAMLVPTVIQAYFYAFEARSYALVLAFGALALLGWQLATEGVWRRPALIGLAASLALATSSNYYAVLLLLPLALGELVRDRALRRIDRPVWLAFSGALVPLLGFIQLIRSSRSYSAHFWGHATWRSPTNFYAYLVSTRLTGRLLDRDLAVLALILLVLAVLVLVRKKSLPRGPLGLGALCLGIGVLPLLAFVAADRLGAIALHRREVLPVLLLIGLAVYGALRARSGRSLLASPPPWEVAAAAGFLLIPPATALLAALVTNAYVPRYALPAAIGFSVILPLALYRLEGDRPAVGVGALAILAMCFASVLVADSRGLTRAIASRRETYSFLEHDASGTRPILIDDAHQFLELSHAAPSDVGSRFMYLADPAAAVRASGTDTAERGLLALSGIAPLHVYRYAAFVSHPRPLLALAPLQRDRWGWVLPRLRRHGWRIREVAADGGQALYAVSP